MKKWLIVTAIFLAGRITATAQSPQVQSSADILVGLQKLKVLGAVLYVAAHPDDENTRLLAYLAKDRKYRTGYLSLTRGDGGQNLIGDEQGVSLGLIRTQELLAARRIDGAEQFFSRAFDFGFSKSTDEALRVWNKEKILSDVVWVIRKFRPDVIITRFPPDNRAGHGHHSASAVLAIEAVRAAADPAKFADQLAYVQPWKVKRIMWNTFNFGGLNTQSESQYKLDVGGYNPLLGRSYGEVAAESRSQHKSQGFGVPRQRGSAYEYFTPLDSTAVPGDLMEGQATTWARISMPEIDKKIDSLVSAFQPVNPSAIVPALLQLREQISEKVTDDYWRQQKVKEINDLVKAATGLYFEAVANQQMAVTGDSLQVTFNLVNRSNVQVSNVRVNMADTMFQLTPSTTYNQLYQAVIKQVVRQDFSTDQPYWLREQMDTGSFNVNTRLLIGYAQNPVNSIKITYSIGKFHFAEDLPLKYKYTDPVKGEIYQPVITVPPIVVGAVPPVLLANLKPKHPQYFQVSYKPYANRDTARGSIRLEYLNSVKPKEKNLPQVLPQNRYIQQAFTISYDSLFAKEKPERIYPWIELPDTHKSVRYNNAMKLIQYDHIPSVHYFTPNSIKVIHEEIITEGKFIGYIPGSGDGVLDALKQMGYMVEILDDQALASADLSRYDAIITGVRAYNVKESLNNYYDKLMRYIAGGGNLIVQYNTSSQIGPVKAKIGPYPFNISRTRITDEKAIVNITNPSHTILNFPNKITAKDFEGWVQERSIYHAASWDSKYETVFSMSDPGEQADLGSLIVTKYGKGSFVYTGLVFFRQLPAGVPGAYRLMANLIALNKKKAF
ncbi:PIG-L family deacetylase [Flavihumibacter solisilvae]|uniref:LmbE family protein n=1 Tax=Flavihumibacter solisilvae TaxID=1349421 RepID=A0A0C1LCD5_9BACT|nr:PIG-L family deacetylase [Flavihumibacter solisilvae]KIC93158.1 hypothetical protein OI18_18000 [Flavihumibacter solisilvae]